MKKLLLLKILALATFVVVIFFIWEGNKGFSLLDEGYFWYGTQRVLLGDVPIRDFSSYDPGRYYWSAAFMSLWDDNGIMALRISEAIFQVIGIFVGLLLIASTVKKQDPLYLLLSAIIMMLWMTMRFKVADYSMSIFLIGALAFLVQNPTSKRYFFTGFCVGLAAFFGRNHGVYGIAGSVGVMLWLNIKREGGLGLIKGGAFWSLGVIIGFMPIILMLILMPGFADAFLGSILYLFKLKATNLTLPIPWPWQFNFASIRLDLAIHAVIVRLFFIAIVAFGLVSIIWVIWQKRLNKSVSPALIAASFLALPYAHYAYSRADLVHLCLGVFPLLIGCLVIFSTQSAKVKWPRLISLCLASFLVVFVDHPGWSCYVSKQCVNMTISGNDLIVEPDTASDVNLLRQLAAQYASNGQSFIVTPYWPGAYALLERESPMMDIYAILPSTPADEQVEIEHIKTAQPRFALIYDYPQDGREDLRFKNTHPLINQYIVDNFKRRSDSPNIAYQIYIAKAADAGRGL